MAPNNAGPSGLHPVRLTQPNPGQSWAMVLDARVRWMAGRGAGGVGDGRDRSGGLVQGERVGVGECGVLWPMGSSHGVRHPVSQRRPESMVNSTGSLVGTVTVRVVRDR